MNTEDNLYIGALIPARSASSRLPGKHLKMIEARPAIHHLLERVYLSEYIDKKEDIVVCTGTGSEEELLIEAVQDFGASIWRGDPLDMISRFYNAAQYYEFDVVLRVDGDDILCEPKYMDRVIKTLLSDKSLDYVEIDGLPIGAASKAFTKESLEKVYKHYIKPEKDTGFGAFFTKTGLLNCKTIMPDSEVDILDDARLTLDYDEDLDFFRAVFKELYIPNQLFQLDDILNLLRINGGILNINSFLSKKYQEYSDREIDEANLRFTDEYGVIQPIK